jgi:hypothetical protein
MRNFPYLIALGFLITLFPFWISAGDRGVPKILRWGEGNPSCTFETSDDGKYRYGLWTNEFGVEMAVDADEVRKSNLRIEPLFAIFILIRNRGKDAIAVNPAQMTLGFVGHSHVVEKAIDPDEFAQNLETGAEAFAAQTQREIDKHPERRSPKVAILQAREKSVSETREFLKSRSLRAKELRDSEASGWIFFSEKSKWIGNWKAQEQFVLRIPMAGRVIEFPFALPPSKSDLILRRR